MIEDLRTIVWKEWRSLIGGRARRQVLLTAGMLAVWAIWFPIQMGGRDFITDPIMMAILTITMPMVLAGIIVPDAVAGERERHTLPTLLASRLPDRAILFGKLGFGVGVAWIAAPLMMAIGLLIANLVAFDQAPMFYDPLVLVSALVLGLLIAVLTGSIACFVSLRASTAQEAQQITVLALMVPLMVGGFAIMALLSQRTLASDLVDFLGSPDVWLLVGALLLVLLVADVLLVLAADRRFRRGRLVTRA